MEDSLTHSETYIQKYTRKKGDPIPAKPIAFTEQDEKNFIFLIKNQNQLGLRELQKYNSQKVKMMEERQQTEATERAYDN